MFCPQVRRLGNVAFMANSYGSDDDQNLLLITKLSEERPFRVVMEGDIPKEWVRADPWDGQRSFLSVCGHSEWILVEIGRW